MAVLGDIAVYFKTQVSGQLRSIMARETLPRALFEDSYPGLWDLLISQGHLPARIRRPLPAAKGYAGVLLTAPYCETYAMLSLALLRLMDRELQGAFGTLRIARLLSESAGTPPISVIRIDGACTPSKQNCSVELYTATPLHKPFAIARELSDAHKDLALLMNRPEMAPLGELPCWRVSSARLRQSGDPDHMKGTVSLSSNHPFAPIALEYALIKGFGAKRTSGFGSLERNRRKKAI